VSAQHLCMAYARTTRPAVAAPGIGLLGLIYLIAGVAVAASHHYFRHADTLRLIGSAILAVLLWPLILLGIDLHIRR
jgi:hypothetical protein